MPVLKRLAVVGVMVAAALGLMSVPAGASDHLSHATDSPGVAQRDFGNPVAMNPSGGTSFAAAQPQTVPGEGDPNDGIETGTPSVDLDLVCTRSGQGNC